MNIELDSSEADPIKISVSETAADDSMHTVVTSNEKHTTKPDAEQHVNVEHKNNDKPLETSIAEDSKNQNPPDIAMQTESEMPSADADPLQSVEIDDNVTTNEETGVQLSDKLVDSSNVQDQPTDAPMEETSVGPNTSDPLSCESTNPEIVPVNQASDNSTQNESDMVEDTNATDIKNEAQETEDNKNGNDVSLRTDTCDNGDVQETVKSEESSKPENSS